MAGLSREAIVAAGFELLAAGGVGAITARALAARLGVRPGALYYHLPDMAAVRDEMATVIMRELTWSDSAENGRPGLSPDGRDWPTFLRRSASHMRSVLLRYRDGAKLFSGTYLTDDDIIGSMEVPLRVLTSCGFDLVAALRALQTLSNFVIGHVIEEQHRDSIPGRYTAPERDRRIDHNRFPLTAAANDAFMGTPADAFTWGIDTLIAGIATHLPDPILPD